MNARPTRVRMRFITPAMANTTNTSRKQYISRWGLTGLPNTVGRGTSIEACTPPLIHVTWLIVHSMMSCPARVAMARYKPLMRSDGTPTIPPISAGRRPPGSGAAGRRATDRGEQRGHRATRGQRDPEGRPQAHRQVGRGVGAHRHERAVADRPAARAAGPAG